MEIADGQKVCDWWMPGNAGLASRFRPGAKSRLTNKTLQSEAQSPEDTPATGFPMSKDQYGEERQDRQKKQRFGMTYCQNTVENLQLVNRT
jgi:hypothetical protein